jgi:hypothetical protein
MMKAVLDHCKETGRSAYIVLNDIAKAFDSVSPAAVMRSHRRIKLPYTYSIWRWNTFKRLHTRVVTAFGLTPGFKVGSMIQQGTVLGPLEWRIFWDTALCLISDNTEGYTLQTQLVERLDEKGCHGEQLQAKINAFAFVDNTSLVASTRKDSAKQRNILYDFQYYNTVSSNVGKMALVVANDDELGDTVEWPNGEPINVR